MPSALRLFGMLDGGTKRELFRSGITLIFSTRRGNVNSNFLTTPTSQMQLMQPRENLNKPQLSINRINSNPHSPPHLHITHSVEWLMASRALTQAAFLAIHSIQATSMLTIINHHSSNSTHTTITSPTLLKHNIPSTNSRRGTTFLTSHHQIRLKILNLTCNLH